MVTGSPICSCRAKCSASSRGQRLFKAASRKLSASDCVQGAAKSFSSPNSSYRPTVRRSCCNSAYSSAKFMHQLVSAIRHEHTCAPSRSLTAPFSAGSTPIAAVKHLLEKRIFIEADLRIPRPCRDIRIHNVAAFRECSSRPKSDLFVTRKPDSFQISKNSLQNSNQVHTNTSCDCRSD